MMMRRSIRSLALLAVVGVGVARAQQPTATQERVPSLELTYDYVHTNGPVNQCGCIGLNGGGVAYVHPIGGSPVSAIGSVTATHTSAIGVPGYSLTLVTYTAGARYVPRLHSASLQPYGEVQAGGVHAGGTLASAPNAAGNGIGSAFAATMGGGVNLLLHRGISFKLIDAQYLLTKFPNGSNNRQNDVRLSAGVVFSLCSPKRCAK